MVIFLLAAHVRIHPGKTVIAFLLFSVQWILGALELCFILYFLNNPVDVWDSLFLDTLIIVLKSTATFIPGQLGVEELINKFTLQLLGLSSFGLWLPVSYKQAILQTGIPWYNVMGNHDMNYDATEDRLSDESFEAHFGPNNYAFNYGKTHFIVLDDILYPHPLTGKGYWGALRDDQPAFERSKRLKKIMPRRYRYLTMSRLCENYELFPNTLFFATVAINPFK
jgi:hypothetical protein